MRSSSFKMDLTEGYTPSRFPQLDNRRLYNFYTNKGALYPTAGNEKIGTFVYGDKGRGIFASDLINRLITVYDRNVFQVDCIGNHILLNTGLPLSTGSGNVSISENGVNQIAICDGSKLYIYDTKTLEFIDAALPDGVTAGMVTFQDDYFIINDPTNNQFYVSDVNDGKNFPELKFTTATSKTIGVASFKKQLLVFQVDGTEIYYDAAVIPFPYQKSPVAYEYGCVSRDTIASGHDVIFWLGRNRNSSPEIVFSSGGNPKSVSIGDIDYLLSTLKNPEDSSGFVYQLDGITLYQISFKSDNLCLLYNLTENKFSIVTDNKFNINPVENIAILNNIQYAISREDGFLHKFGLDISTVSGEAVTRIFSTKNYESSMVSMFNGISNKKFGIRKLSLSVEQGVEDSPKKCESQDLCNDSQCKLLISFDRGVTFGSARVLSLAKLGKFNQLLEFFNIGSSRFWAFQFEFNSSKRIAVFNINGEVMT